jgi:L-ribulose-5-phosphate 4-epimerase
MGKLEFKKEVVQYAKLLEAKGLVNPVEGNISVYDRENDELYITPSAVRKSFLTENMVAVLKDGKQIDGDKKYSSEVLLHYEALKARPDCDAVVHVHAPYMTAYAYCGKDIELKCSTTFALLFEKIPCIPYGEANTIHIADGLADAIKTCDIVLLGNHGVVAVGKTLEDAVKIVEAAEEVLKIYELTKTIGPVLDIPDDKYEHLLDNHPASKRNRYK